MSMASQSNKRLLVKGLQQVLRWWLEVLPMRVCFPILMNGGPSQCRWTVVGKATAPCNRLWILWIKNLFLKMSQMAASGGRGSITFAVIRELGFENLAEIWFTCFFFVLIGLCGPIILYILHQQRSLVTPSAVGYKVFITVLLICRSSRKTR